MTDTSAALTEPSPESISELFNRDPLSLSLVDRRRLIEELRAQAARNAAAAAAGEKPGRPLKSSDGQVVRISQKAADLL